MKRILRYLVDIFLVLLFFNLLMFYRQPSMTFYPERELLLTPADWRLVYEEASFKTGDGITLHGWYLPREGSRRALLFFHGNGGNISHRGDSLQIFHRLGFNIFIFDYRGYGQSGGEITEAGLYLDATAAWRYLTEARGFEGKDIVLFGRSLGGAVASRLATEVQPGALVLESTFSSARDMAQAVFPLLSRLVVMRYDFDTAAYVSKVHCPVLVLHSPDDDIIPFALGRQVYAAANRPKAFITLQGDHNSGFIVSQPAYEQGLADFLSVNSFGNMP